MRRPFIILLAANAVSVTGNMLSVLAVPWLVLDTTGSAALTGLAAFATAFPMIVSAAFGATIVDWMGFRGASVLSDVASGVLVLTIPVLSLTIGLSYPALLLLLFVRWLAATPGETARKAMLPDLAELGGVRIERATAAYDGIYRGATMVGGPLAGVLILWIGPSALLFFDGFTFLLSAALVGGGIPGSRGRVREAGRYLGDLRDGLTFLWRDRLQTSATAMIVVTNMLDTGMTQVLLVLYARDVAGDPRAFGLLTGALGAGAVAGTIVYGAAGRRLPPRLTFGWCFLVAGVPRVLVLALGAPFPVALAAAALSGFAAGAINPILGVLQFDRIPAELRARVLGAITAAAYAGMPIGGLLAGSLTELTGLTVTLFAFTSVYLVVSVPPFVVRAWRELDQSCPAHPP
ncbi:MFS transporter [Nonomuraea jiangxiensis]|uniref:Major Facilitator Superfamily protein n=1 Tax=Nonomuraea jiangxiensis TaxID=633440 RepID=A0A1G8WEW6_9ACTN|nr:MFS transporter [Nonomuraea jiangxiensis]SDJ76753.1 Major Facilitator Superfamily protein [Nonomuraea jiangxiensis]